MGLKSILFCLPDLCSCNTWLKNSKSVQGGVSSPAGCVLPSSCCVIWHMLVGAQHEVCMCQASLVTTFPYVKLRKQRLEVQRDRISV